MHRRAGAAVLPILDDAHHGFLGKHAVAARRARSLATSVHAVAAIQPADLPVLGDPFDSAEDAAVVAMQQETVVIGTGQQGQRFLFTVAWVGVLVSQCRRLPCQPSRSSDPFLP